ncbi:MAG: GtrA family protein [Legionellaceae bacterium]|nr:GtrA family protein [Legionellaceae bacterium]
MRKPVLTALLPRLFYFALTGGLAALVHISVVYWLVSRQGWLPLSANLCAFLFAFQLSFLGHRYFTFHNLPEQKRLRFPHYFLIAVSACLLNELAYYLLLHFTSLSYLTALIMVLLGVAVYTFSASRYWACR